MTLDRFMEVIERIGRLPSPDMPPLECAASIVSSLRYVEMNCIPDGIKPSEISDLRVQLMTSAKRHYDAYASQSQEAAERFMEALSLHDPNFYQIFSLVVSGDEASKTE